jgi:DNA polymerase-3 subunit gamma/tau
MPAHSNYKIYIIDEVHMLSMAAFNALLKTLEEPPAHVMFIFATTEPHKIPITILSRCQRHDFRRISLDSISNYMASLCRQENLEISNESLGIIAREASGSMRDALSLLDQIMTCTQGVMSHEQVLDILGVIDRKFIFDLAESILGGDNSRVLDLLDDIYDRGHDMKRLCADLLAHFRNLLVAAMGQKVDKLIDLPSGELEQLVQQSQSASSEALHQIFDMLFKDEVTIRLSPQPKLALEMTLIKILQTKPSLPIDTLIDKLEILRQDILASGFPQGKNAKPSTPKATEESDDSGSRRRSSRQALDTRTEETGASDQSISRTEAASKDLDKLWAKICEIISEQHPSLAANLAKCRLKESKDRSVEIEVPGNGFTLNMIQREKNLVVLKQVCADILGGRKNIQFATGNCADGRDRKKKNDDQLKQKALNHPLVADAIEIFNGRLLDIKILKDFNRASNT